MCGVHPVGPDSAPISSPPTLIPGVSLFLRRACWNERPALWRSMSTRNCPMSNPFAWNAA